MAATRQRFSLGPEASVELLELRVDVRELVLEPVYLGCHVQGGGATVLSAFDDTPRIGRRDGSSLQTLAAAGFKGALAGFVAQMALGLAFPQVRLLRGLWVATSAAATGWAKWRRNRELRRIEEVRRERNAEAPENSGDAWRANFAELMHGAQLEEQLPLEPNLAYGRILGGRVPNKSLQLLRIGHDERVNVADVRRRFAEQLRKVHPDMGGSAEKTFELLEARERAMDALYL